MAAPNIIQFLSFNSSLAPLVMKKKVWKGLADKHIEEGAIKIISSQATKAQNQTPQAQLKFISKNIWKLDKFTAFMNINHLTSNSKTWPVHIQNMGIFIVATKDFKNLQLTMKNMAVEMITSSVERCVIAVRLRLGEEALHMSRYEVGDKLRQIVNEILCGDYENFVGYVLYKRIDINLDYEEKVEQPVFDWIVEIYLANGAVGSLQKTIAEEMRKLGSGGMEVQYGMFQDDGFLSKDATGKKTFLKL